MEITISIPPDVQDRLRQRAVESGQDVAGYVETLIERDLSSSMSLRDLYAPVRRQIEQSGISENELDALIEEAREEAYQERKGRTGER